MQTYTHDHSGRDSAHPRMRSNRRRREHVGEAGTDRRIGGSRREGTGHRDGDRRDQRRRDRRRHWLLLVPEPIERRRAVNKGNDESSTGTESSPGEREPLGPSLGDFDEDARNVGLGNGWHRPVQGRHLSGGDRMAVAQSDGEPVNDSLESRSTGLPPRGRRRSSRAWSDHHR